jgi:hypothetical protein
MNHQNHLHIQEGQKSKVGAEAVKNETQGSEVRSKSEGLTLRPEEIALVEAVNEYGEDDGEY